MIIGVFYWFNNQWCLLDEPGWEYITESDFTTDLRPWYAPIEDEE